MTPIVAAVTRGGGPFSIEPAELDAPRPDEVVVRIAAVGVCHTDLTHRTLTGPGPAVLGHEGAGVIEAVGSDVHGFAAGDTVILSMRTCGTCRHCVAGHPAYCTKAAALNYAGRRTDGSATVTVAGEPAFGGFFGQSSFASHALTSASNLVRVDADIDLGIAAPLGCGFQTGAGAVLNVLRPSAGARVVIHGGGSVGLAAALAARTMADQVVVVDPLAARRALATDLGCDVLDPADGDPVDLVRDITRGRATHALDTTGRTDVIAGALASLDSLGVLCLVALGPRQVAFDHLDLLTRGKTVRGSIEGDSTPAEFIPQLIQMWGSGAFPIDRLVTRFAFADIEQAIAAQHAGEIVKPVLLLT